MSGSSSTTASHESHHTFPDLSPTSPPPDPHPLSDQPTSFVPTHQPTTTNPTNPIRAKIDSNRIVNRVKRVELEKRQEESVLACDVQIRAFASCATGRTFSTVWACKTENDEMHKCMAN